MIVKEAMYRKCMQVGAPPLPTAREARARLGAGRDADACSMGSSTLSLSRPNVSAGFLRAQQGAGSTSSAGG